MSTHSSKHTTDHDSIRRWAEARGGHPASVRGTAGDGMLRIDFNGQSRGEERLEPLSWDEFFRKFDASHLDFVYQEQTQKGETSHFCRFVVRR